MRFGVLISLIVIPFNVWANNSCIDIFGIKAGRFDLMPKSGVSSYRINVSAEKPEGDLMIQNFSENGSDYSIKIALQDAQGWHHSSYRMKSEGTEQNYKTIFLTDKGEIFGSEQLWLTSDNARFDLNENPVIVHRVNKFEEPHTHRIYENSIILEFTKKDGSFQVYAPPHGLVYVRNQNGLKVDETYLLNENETKSHGLLP